MTTHKRIQAETKRRFGFVPTTCWIADVKAEMALISREAANRVHPGSRKYRCSPDKRAGLRNVISALN